jgi:hypothetical protein
MNDFDIIRNIENRFHLDRNDHITEVRRYRELARIGAALVSDNAYRCGHCYQWKIKPAAKVIDKEEVDLDSMSVYYNPVPYCSDACAEHHIDYEMLKGEEDYFYQSQETEED